MGAKNGEPNSRPNAALTRSRLAAFGARGYGKEAAEAILDVVKEYDWSFLQGDLVGKLQNAAVQAFNGERLSGRRSNFVVAPIPIESWLPVLEKEIRAAIRR